MQNVLSAERPLLSDSARASYREEAYAEGSSLLEKVEALRPAIEARAAATETLGRVPAESLQAMREAGLFRAFTPRQFGGSELDPASFFEALMRLGSACPSTSWVGGFYGVHAWQIALMDKRLQEEVWADGPDTAIASSYAPTGKVTSVDGGFHLNGVWSFCSGVDGADWIILGGLIRDAGGEPEMRSFVVPRKDFTIDPDSWNVVGLSGSGSRSILLKDAFVPDYRTHRISDVYARTERGFEVNDRPLYRVAWMSIFYHTIGAVAIGAATGGVASFVDHTRSRISVASGQAAAQNPFLHLRLANAASALEGLRARALARWREDFDRACAGSESDSLFRKRSRFEAADNTAVSFKALSEVFEIAGGNSIDADRPMQRFLRDLMAMRNHPTAQREAFASIYVQDLLGVAPPPFSTAAMANLLLHA